MSKISAFAANASALAVAASDTNVSASTVPTNVPGGAPTVALAAAEELSNLKIVNLSDREPSVAIMVTCLFVPKFAKDSVRVFPVPPSVTDGEEVQITVPVKPLNVVVKVIV